MPYTTYVANFTATRDIREVDLQKGRGVTDWWMKDPVLFPFGFGLEYTDFSYAWANDPPMRTLLEIPTSGDTDALDTFVVDHSVVVTNTGARASAVVVLAFVVATPGSPPDTPIKKLFGFERLANLAPGENATVRFATDAASLGVVGATGAKQLLPGTYRIEVGSVVAPASRGAARAGPALRYKSL
jgi:beta-D-xylosidase 4